MESEQGMKTRIPAEKILDIVPMVVLVVNKDYRIAYVNRPSGRLPGWAYDELTGMTGDITDGREAVDKNSPLGRLVAETIRTGLEQRSQESVPGTESFIGRTFQISTVFIDASSQTVVTILDTTGTVAKSSGVSGDVSGLLDTVGNICHDMNQPLQVASGSLDLALMMCEDTGKDLDLIVTARDQMYNVATIARKLMNLRYGYKH